MSVSAACALAIAASGVVGAFVAHARAADRTPAGRIVFASAREGGLAIYTMTASINSDGKVVVEQTSKSLGPGVNPKWSRRGNRIAFIRSGDVYVMNASGAAVRRLTKSPGDDKNPSWSPDEAQIAFASNREPHKGNYEIYVKHVDGSAPLKRLTNSSAEDRYPAWSPDGKRIAFQSDEQIYVMGADGKGKKKLTDAGSNVSPAWSPDGTRIAFASNRHGNYEIYSMSAVGKSLNRLTTDEPDKPFSDTDPAWSPDGEHIAFTTSRGGKGDIYVMKESGEDPVRLTQDEAEDTTSDWWPDVVPTVKLLERRVASGVVKITADGPDGDMFGTGFLVGSHFVATARHVVGCAQNIVLSGDPPRPVTIVGSDESADIALLHSNEPISGYEFSFAGRSPAQDDAVVILGYPEDSRRLKRRNGTVVDVSRDLLRVSPGVAAGNSGGPVIRGPTAPNGEAGDVIGLAFESDAVEDETLARPAAVVRQKVDRWRQKFQPASC